MHVNAYQPTLIVTQLSDWCRNHKNLLKYLMINETATARKSTRRGVSSKRCSSKRCSSKKVFLKKVFLKKRCSSKRCSSKKVFLKKVFLKKGAPFQKMILYTDFINRPLAIILRIWGTPLLIICYCLRTNL